MEKVTKPTVSTLATGSVLVAKQMQAKAGELLPEHLASLESILFVHEGECIFKINGSEQVLKPGDSVIVPPEVKHQIKAVTDLKAVHFMPNEIKFKFFN